MKAHVVTQVPKRVLLYAIEQAKQAELSAVLQKLSIEEYTLSADELGQDVGYLAGFPGFVKKESALCEPPHCNGVMCMCGLSNVLMDELLNALKENEISIPLKAIVTATNQNWSFDELIRELIKEREAIALSLQNRKY